MIKGKERAAMLLSLLGSKYSEGILDHLPPDVSDVIADTLAKTKRKPSQTEISEIIGEVNKYKTSIVSPGAGAMQKTSSKDLSPP